LLIDEINFQENSLLSINDLKNEQIYDLFNLAKLLEKWNRKKINLVTGNLLASIFYQPSTRTRLSFETAMARLGGDVVTESTPLISSSAAKEESLKDTLKVVSKYANVIVLRHPNDIEARNAVPYSDCPIINGGFGNWEHPTQALLDLYTLWRVYGKIKKLNVCIATPDLIAARTGHSMAYGLLRLGANVTLATQKNKRIPMEILSNIEKMGKVKEEFNLEQDEFNELAKEMDLIYFPGCSAPKGEESEKFKKLMDRYYLKYDTLKEVYDKENKIVYVTHTLPRREGEIDTRIDDSPFQLYFKAILHSVSIRMALLSSILGVNK
jgi:aspartate carbamoyltransferase catalytic subunit